MPVFVNIFAAIFSCILALMLLAGLNWINLEMLLTGIHSGGQISFSVLCTCSYCTFDYYSRLYSWDVLQVHFFIKFCFILSCLLWDKLEIYLLWRGGPAHISVPFYFLFLKIQRLFGNCTISSYLLLASSATF